MTQTYIPGSLRLKVLANDPHKAARWPFPLKREDKIYLLTAWADEGTFSDLESLTDAELEVLWQGRLETAE